MNKKYLFLLPFCLVTLSSCSPLGEELRTTPGYYDQNSMYISSSYSDISDNYSQRPTQEVVVPDSYHVGAYHAPESFKDRDRTWVNSQNPQAYTIELADDPSAAQVAQKLYQAPKKDRMAQLRYDKSGSTYYTGLYGSYDSAQSAQQALDQLPEGLKGSAKVKQWSTVQQLSQ